MSLFKKDPRGHGCEGNPQWSERSSNIGAALARSHVNDARPRGGFQPAAAARQRRPSAANGPRRKALVL